MPVRVASYIVSGAAGTGRTTALRSWIDETDRATRSAPFVIEPRTRTPSADDLRAWDLDAPADAAIAVDDAELLEPSMLDLVRELAMRRPVGVALAPWPVTVELDGLLDLLSSGSPVADPASVRRTQPMVASDIAAAFGPFDDTSGVTADGLVRLASGNGALCAALCAGGWGGDLDAIPEASADAIMRRIRRLPGDAVDTLRLAALGMGVDTALSRSGHDAVGIERALLASGLVIADGLVVPVVERVLLNDATPAERRTLADAALGRLDDETGVPAADRARLVSMSSTADPVARTEAALWLGHADAGAHLAAVADLDGGRAAGVAFADDVRQLRLDRAVRRPIGDGAMVAARRVIEAMTDPVGAFEAPTQPISPTAVGGDVWSGVWGDAFAALRSYALGEVADACSEAARLADDAVRAGDPPLAGVSPSAISALLLLQAGRPERAREIAARAARLGVDGPGEHRTLSLLESLAAMQGGDYSGGLDAVRPGESGGEHCGRDELLVAAGQALVARRSGDTGRLRDAWRVARRLLDRGLVTWLLCDQLVDLAATGARLGDLAVADDVVARLGQQLRALGAAGPGPVMHRWASLQVDIAAERWAAIAAAADSTSGPISGAAATNGVEDPRSAARLAACRSWRLIAAGLTDPDAADREAIRTEAHSAAGQLAACGDGWDASRLLGQAALDEPDPALARQLLEGARDLSAEPVDTADGLVAAGLSEREAEVSRLVAEGQTYKEIGAQLYISPKTVEHHVAKIRQRLGASSRAELLATIRELAGP